MLVRRRSGSTTIHGIIRRHERFPQMGAADRLPRLPHNPDMLCLPTCTWRITISPPKGKKSDLSVFPATEAYIGMARALSSRGHDFTVGGSAGASLAEVDPTAQDACRFGTQVISAAAFLIGIGPMRRASPLRQERTHVEHAVGTRPSRKAPALRKIGSSPAKRVPIIPSFSMDRFWRGDHRGRCRHHVPNPQ